MIKHLWYFVFLIYLSVTILLTVVTESVSDITDLKNTDSTINAGSDIYKQIQSLKIEWNGYILGSPLNSLQKKTALQNQLPSTTFGTYRFRDKNMNIVAEDKKDRVLIIFETVENASKESVQDIIGSLILAFKDPTVYAHDKTIYWAYGQKGKYSRSEFDDSKDRQEPLDIIATVKLQSEVPIMEKGQEDISGNLYYIISSERILKYFNTK